MFENREGQKVPQVTFKTREGGDWKEITSDQLFGGRTVVLFALPGAFTPTCSTSHLPRYDELYPVFREAGVDEVVCLSVNDGFVMDAWGKASNVGDKVLMLADGNAEYAKALGLELDATGFGMGVRGQRFAIYAVDGVVKGLYVEAPGAFKVSSAEHVLSQL